MGGVGCLLILRPSGGDLKKKLEKQKMNLGGIKKKTPQFVRNPVEKKHKKPRNVETRLCQICR